MRSALFAIAGSLFVCLGVAAAGGPAQGRVQGPATQPAPAQAAPLPLKSHETSPADAQTALVKQYCTGCHNDRAKAGGLTLASFDAANAVGHLDVAEKMIRKLRAGMMPPAGARRPDGAELVNLAIALENRIDRAAALNPNPGWRPFQRLNRAEYSTLGPRSARHRRRCHDLPAAGHRERRVRQRGRRPGVLAGVDGRLSARGQPDQHAGGRRSHRQPRGSRRSRCRARCRSSITSRARRSARAAASRSSTSFPRTASTSCA